MMADGYTKEEAVAKAKKQAKESVGKQGRATIAGAVKSFAVSTVMSGFQHAGVTENPYVNFIAKVGVNVLATNVGNEIIRKHGKKWGFIDEE